MSILLFSLESMTGLPEAFGYIFVFLLGTIIGSFLNVVIHRVPNEESVVFPNSACPKCKSAIKSYDNIPVFSWLILGGKCRNCKNPISARYPAVEFMTGLVFLLVYWQVGFTAFLPVALIFVAVMISLIFIDAENMILPNVITYPLLVFAIIVRLAFPLAIENFYFSDMKVYPLSAMTNTPAWAVSLIGALMGGLLGGGLLWGVGELWKRLRGVDAMGMGDVKMMFGVGALLGWQLTFLTIFLGAFTGAVVGIALIARQKDKTMQTMIPFGIFLGLGSVISMLFGERLIVWYLTTFVPQ